AAREAHRRPRGAGANARETGLATGESRLALLDESGHALLLVLGREEHGEEGRLLVEARLVRALEGKVDGLLRVRERERALRRQSLRHLEHLLPQLAVLIDGVHEPAPLRLLGADEAAGQDQLLREAEAADAREPLRPAPA